MKIIAVNGREFDIEEYVIGNVGPGWHNLIRELVVDLVNLGWDQHLLQLKEKYGGLRFYIGSGSDEIYTRINKAEHDSVTICEQCGSPGEQRGGGWIFTRCDGCWETLRQQNYTL